MNAQSLDAKTDSPLNEFSGCHARIICNFKQLQRMVRLLEQQEESPEIRDIAQKLLRYFDDEVLSHHSDEEQELFTAVMDCAAKGEEKDIARTYIKRLIDEHRHLEKMWDQIKRDMQKLADGKSADLDREIAASLAHEYLAHAEFEENFFLPMAAQILNKNEMSALGLSLHMRHFEESLPDYI